MIKSIKLLTAIAAIILMSSFTDKNLINYTGTYGVSGSDPSQIKLTINTNHTFYYQDYSSAANKIVVKGNWTLNGKKVALNDNSSEKNFHSVWTFAENGRIAKSRKGLTFYRLCKID